MNFPKDFFREEIRNDFCIAELMKRAWAAELEVLEVVDNICQKHNIPWFADFGTLLGAVRHHGFIPWDDDIDITLKRPDYNRLINLLKTELPEGFSLAGMYAEEERLQNAAYLPNTLVIADDIYWEFSNYLRRFHGYPFFCIGIDIFPQDYIPREAELFSNQRAILIKLRFLLDVLNPKKKNPLSSYEPQLRELEKLCGTSLPRDNSISNRLWKLYDSISSQYGYEEADNMTLYHTWIENPNRFYRKECYDSSLLMPFENISIPVPNGWHEILSSIYGDYQVPVKNAGAHGYPFYAEQKEALEKLFQKKGITRNITEFCRDFMEQVYEEEAQALESSQNAASEQTILDLATVKKRLTENANLFYQQRNAEGMQLFPGTVEMIVQIPEFTELIEPLFQAIENKDYILAADIFCHGMAERIN